MSEMIQRVSDAIYACQFGTRMAGDFSEADAKMCARAAIEAMRPEFERISEAYSPRHDDTVWIDDRTPIGLFVDSIINDCALSERT